MERRLIESGIDWIGEIPENWRISRVKEGFYRKKEEAHQEDPVVLSLARSGVRVRDISTNEGQIAESYYNYNIVSKGDLLLNPMDLYSGANCSISKIAGVISPAYINLGAREGFCSSYYDYYFKTQYWAMALFAHGKGVSFDNRWTLSHEDLMRYYIPVPSYNEQVKISDFLDRECEEIDVVINKTRDSLEEYKKLKRAVITDAVTKGSLSANSPEVPDGWENRKLKTFISIPVVDGPHESPELFETGVPYISATAIENGKINFDLMRGYISEEYCLECDKRYKPQRNDILVVKLGASTGQVAIVESDDRFNIWVPLAAVRCNDQVNSRFIYYCFQSEYLIRQMELSWTFGTQQTLGVKTIEQLKFLIPPLEEQLSIVSYLDRKCSDIDALLVKKTKFLAEIEDYKKSLIFEYVTGKKEVV